MVESIETFVAKLQSDGVEAGKQAAEELRMEAQREAEKLIADAKAEADKIIAGAKTEAENLLTRSKTDLELAVRDAMMRLRDAINKAMTAIIVDAVKTPLSSEELLKQLIHELVVQYAQADIHHKGTIKIELTAEMHKKLAEFVINEIYTAASGEHVSIDLKGHLRQAGFEYSRGSGTIEVTESSVVETLSSLVNPMLQEMFKKALSDKAE